MYVYIYTCINIHVYILQCIYMNTHIPCKMCHRKGLSFSLHIPTGPGEDSGEGGAAQNLKLVRLLKPLRLLKMKKVHTFRESERERERKRVLLHNRTDF